MFFQSIVSFYQLCTNKTVDLRSHKKSFYGGVNITSYVNFFKTFDFLIFMCCVRIKFVFLKVSNSFLNKNLHLEVLGLKMNFTYLSILSLNSWTQRIVGIKFWHIIFLNFFLLPRPRSFHSMRTNKHPLPIQRIVSSMLMLYIRENFGFKF